MFIKKIFKIISDDNAIGLIPSLDLLSFKDLFISSEIGISFNALLSNSYIHFKGFVLRHSDILGPASHRIESN